jgi:hypothetical protein
MYMKKHALAIFMMLFLGSACAMAQSDAQKNFEKMKALAGSWKGKTSDGRPVEVSYRVTSGGSALMSEIRGEEDMITMFHLDGDRLLMTHYCGAGNQPRMKAEASPDAKTVAFNFLDATNLPSPETGHMHRAVFTMVDANHHKEEWVFTKDGKEQKELFAMVRAK